MPADATRCRAYLRELQYAGNKLGTDAPSDPPPSNILAQWYYAKYKWNAFKFDVCGCWSTLKIGDKKE